MNADQVSAAKQAVDSYSRLLDDALPGADLETIGELIEIAESICTKHFGFARPRAARLTTHGL